GTKFAPVIWKSALVAALAGIAAIIYMIALSMFSYGTICPWCFGTWITTIATLWTIITYITSARPIKLKGKADAVAKVWTKYAPMILAGTYVLLVFILLVRFNESLL